jgi:hypothetical protein
MGNRKRTYARLQSSTEHVTFSFSKTTDEICDSKYLYEGFCTDMGVSSTDTVHYLDQKDEHIRRRLCCLHLQEEGKDT